MAVNTYERTNTWLDLIYFRAGELLREDAGWRRGRAYTLRTLGDSVKTAFASIGDALADQEIRTEARQTAGSFFDALGATFAELGADIAKQRDQDSPDQPPSDEPMSQDAPESE